MLKNKEYLKKEIIVDIGIILLALSIGFFIRDNVFGFSKVQGNSMSPTFENGQFKIIEKWGKNNPDFYKRGDIICIKFPEMESLFVKRIVGIPGDNLSIKNGIVYINGSKYKEDYVHALEKLGEQNFGEIYNLQYENLEIHILENEFFVMGDNRLNSIDSRTLGTINRANIVGKIKK